MKKKYLNILVCLLIIVIINSFLFTRSSNGNNIINDRNIISDFYTSTKNKEKNNLKIIKDEDVPAVKVHACERSTIFQIDPNLTWLTCVKNEYELMSKYILQMEDCWEPAVSRSILEVMLQYPDAVYLDIGANIGPFVTMVATLGNRVVAVEPIITNLAYLRKSLEVADLRDRVTLINNAVSDEQMELIPWLDNRANEATVTMLTKEEAKLKKTGEVFEAVNSVTLDKILNIIQENTIIMKIDVESFECKVLRNYLYSTKKSHFIPYIIMEWVSIGNNVGGNCPNLQEIIQGFEKSGYSAMSIGGSSVTKPISVNEHSDLVNVVWVHEKAVKLPPIQPKPQEILTPSGKRQQVVYNFKYE